jgi:predicted dehydrogenase
VEQDIRKLLDDPSVDAVSIATPNHWHTLAAIWAIQAGKDVYVEKPASHNIAEGRRLMEFAEKHKKIVQHGTQSRSDGAVRNAMKFIHDGKIGPVRLARALCYKRRPSIGDVQAGVPVDPAIDYNLWLGPAPEKPVERNQFHYDWHWQWDYGNGDMGNQGVHEMDKALWGLNKKTLADKVQCVGGRVGYKDDGETPNTMATFLDWSDDGSRIIFEVRGLETAHLQGVGVGNFFYGSEGYVVIGSGNPKAYNYKGELLEVFDDKGGTDHFRNFLEAVKSRKPEDLNAGVLECHLSSGLCHQGNVAYVLGSKQSYQAAAAPFAGDESASETLKRMGAHLAASGVDVNQQEFYLGRKLAFDPKAEQFTGDGAEEANKLVKPVMRAPWTFDTLALLR